MKVDVAIVGGGLVGGTLACALAPCGASIALIEPKPARPVPTAGFDQRIYALSGRSLRLLERCAAWRELQLDRVAPVHGMRVFGDDNVSQLEFSAYRSRVAELACIVEESNLQSALARAMGRQAGLNLLSGVECVGMQAGGSAVELALSDGSRIETRLAVAADGAGSKLREGSGIVATVHDYGQHGVVANFLAGRPHRNVAHQWFREDGILALLPLPGNHVSMVWSAADAVARKLMEMEGPALAQAVEQASSHALGALSQTGAAASFPLRRMHVSRLVAQRLVLIGDAAHNVHPLAGQGLNLGLGDVDSLAQVLSTRGREDDCGAASLLRRYEISRREDILAMELVTDGLQRLFGSNVPGASWLRNTGLRLTDRLSPLKRSLVKRALG